MVREIIAYGENYREFMDGLSEAERNKILRALLLFTDNERIPAHYIKHLEDGIYEFRVTHISNEFRIIHIPEHTRSTFRGCIQRPKEVI